MGLFGKKKGDTDKTVQDIPNRVTSDVKPQEEQSPIVKRRSDSIICVQQLQSELQSGNRGVAMKLYIRNFKGLNELFGFERCEGMLTQILDYLEEETQCTVYRYVGVQFIIILREYNQHRTISLVERILERFSRGWKIGETECGCNIHIGLCAYPGYADTAYRLLECLDLAASRAMGIGDNQYAFYDHKLDLLYLRNQAIAKNLASALEHNELETRYRATYDVKKKKFTHAEFYMRIFVPELGMVGGIEFIPIAEESGQIRKLTQYALEKTAAKIAELSERKIEFEFVAVWISPVLFQQTDFVEMVADVVDRYHLPKGKFAIEIEGNNIGSSYNKIVELTADLADLGVEMILNNYGSGSSGLSQMLNISANTLKFERLYTWQLETDERSEPVIDGLIHIANRLGKRVIAEGIETEHQVELLDRFGCELRQGFYYAPTIPSDLLSSVLGRSMEDCREVLDQERAKLL
jgi:EAL domain-containing protein (putative c-di-GMP-specific phosphodiesterase class I)/GGDEF domain-containing protein